MYNRISLKELNRKECLRYLGCNQEKAENILNGTEAQDISRLIDECEKEILAAAEPRYVYRVFDIEQECDNISSNSVHLKGTDFELPGNSIKEHLSGCEKAVFVAATISLGVDRLIGKAQHQDMTKAVITDSLASVAIEQLCDEVEKIIKRAYSDYYQTFRFGIGYGDLPITMQSKFIKLLNADKVIGLNVNKSCMLIPTKSVTAIIGLSKNELKSKVRGCQTCNLRETCRYRQKGGRCNG